MPRRLTPFVTEEFYHVFNRSINRQPILLRKSDLKFFDQLAHYYIQAHPPIKFSYYRTNPEKYKLDFNQRLVTIISYCYMPNHFHFSLRQEKEGGVQKFMQKILNSFSHYHTLKYDSHGPLFESAFKAVQIETNKQLIHLSRYHHLNPVTAHIVEYPEDYAYSSYQNYMGIPSTMVDPSHVMHHFSSRKDYKKFVLDQKNYQRELDQIKHLLLV